MDNFALERAFAYEQLHRWVPKYEQRYAENPQMADTFLARSLVIERVGEARFATPEELQAALVLYHIVCIEDCVETGEADELLDGVPVLKHLADGLHRHLSTLAEITGRKMPTTGKPLSLPANTISVESDELLKRRQQQLEVILAVIDALQFNPMAIPDGGKSKIKEICLKCRSFTPSGFEHAWKAGVKAQLFRHENHEKFAPT